MTKRLRQGDAISWSLPPPGFHKLNFDGSKLKDGKASCGFVVRDNRGEVILAGAKALRSSLSIIQAEAWGLRKGVRAALGKGVSQVIIEGDNMAVIDSIKKLWRIPWEIENIITDVARDLNQFSFVQVTHIFREANRAADFMASKGHFHSSLVLSYSPFDVDFLLIIHKDVLGWPPD